MLAAPPVTVKVVPGSAWLLGLGGLCWAMILCVMAWAWQRHDGLGAAVACVWSVYAVWLLRAASRQPPMVLRWDGQLWHLTTARQGAEPLTRSGSVSVGLDLGRHLLVRFHVEAPAATLMRQSVWLALQRSQLAPEWHGLRCALHAPPQMPKTEASEPFAG